MLIHSRIDPTSHCPGHLELLIEEPDRVLVDGVMAERLIRVYRCAACETRLSVADNALLNAYKLPAPGGQLRPTPPR